MWLLLTALANPYLSGSPLGEAPAAVDGDVDRDPFVWEVPAVTGEAELVVVLRIPEGHAIYEDQIGIRATEGTIGEPVLPKASLEEDPTEPGSWRAIHRGDLQIRIPVQPGRIALELSHQGCRKGLCWPRKTVNKTVMVTR